MILADPLEYLHSELSAEYDAATKNSGDNPSDNPTSDQYAPVQSYIPLNQWWSELSTEEEISDGISEAEKNEIMALVTAALRSRARTS